MFYENIAVDENVAKYLRNLRVRKYATCPLNAGKRARDIRKFRIPTI
jgi:hypothetical protein